MYITRDVIRIPESHLLAACWRQPDGRSIADGEPYEWKIQEIDSYNRAVSEEDTVNITIVRKGSA